MTLPKAVVANPHAHVEEVPLSGDSERHRLLVEWNDTRADFPCGKCVHELFEVQAANSPDAVAVEFAGGQLSYRELNVRANLLACHLREMGVGPERLVGICVERSLEMVVALLGILKAGGAYVPLDPDYPSERLAFMLEASCAEFLLTQAKMRSRLGEHHVQVLCLDADWHLVDNIRTRTW